MVANQKFHFDSSFIKIEKFVKNIMFGFSSRGPKLPKILILKKMGCFL